jgi:hypothetical protein
VYNPNQPRLPAGDRYGGRWTSTGIGGGAAGGRYDPANGDRRGGVQLAGAGTLGQGIRDLGPFGAAMVPYLLGVLARLTAHRIEQAAFLGGLVVAAVSELDAAHGALPDQPDIRYRYKGGILTLWRDVPVDEMPLLYHGPAGADGLYRLPDGTVIGRDLGTGVFLNQAAATTKLRVFEETEAANPAANDNIKLCPDAVPDRYSNDKDEWQEYQQKVTGLEKGWGVELNGVMFDGCRMTDGVMLEAKGDGYAWALQEDGEFFPNFKGKQKLVDQMQSQSLAARGRLVEWHVAERPVADYLAKLACNLGLSNIVVIHDPAR